MFFAQFSDGIIWLQAEQSTTLLEQHKSINNSAQQLFLAQHIIRVLDYQSFERRLEEFLSDYF